MILYLAEIMVECWTMDNGHVADVIRTCPVEA
jgi:hypothetical protein